MLDLAVVVVTVNHKRFIGPCVESLLSSRFPGSFGLFVVDDGSTDGTREVLQTYAGRLTLILREGGHSFSDNNNQVLKNVAARYYLVLNPDTILPEQALAEMYNFMETNPAVGASGPKLIYPDGTLQYSCRRFPNPLTVLWRRTPLRYLLPERARGKRHLMANAGHNRLQEVDWLLGACIIFRGEALRQVGYLDEGYRLYCEDIDVCQSLWRTGWQVYYDPSVVVVHDHQAKSDRALFSRLSWWHYRSMFRYLCKYGLAGFRRPNGNGYRPAAPLAESSPFIPKTGQEDHSIEQPDATVQAEPFNLGMGEDWRGTGISRPPGG